jgi:uncharacterized protein (DUF1697 family)
VAAYIALLRAVNVGGNVLPMPALLEMCRCAGFERACTYIASGNALFTSRLGAHKVKDALERRLADYLGKPIEVHVRTAAELAAVLTANPFPEAPPSRTVAVFLGTPPPAGALAAVRGRKREMLALGTREIYVVYPDGLAASKLVIPAARAGTARNMNTVAKLAALAAAL